MPHLCVKCLPEFNVIIMFHQQLVWHCINKLMCSHFLLLHICYIVLPRKINVKVKFLSQVIFVCFWVWKCMLMKLKQKKKKNYPSYKINSNISLCEVFGWNPAPLWNFQFNLTISINMSAGLEDLIPWEYRITMHGVSMDICSATTHFDVTCENSCLSVLFPARDVSPAKCP